MAPYNTGQYGTHYDPVGSQYNQQQSYGYSYGSQRPAATSQDQEAATSSTYGQPSTYTTTYSNNAYYGTGTTPWSSASAQPQSTTENRAAETLSHLSAQEHGQTSSATTRDPNTQYGSSGWGSTYNNTPDTTAAAPHQRTSSNTSPLYSAQADRSNTSVSNYGSGQSYTQPTTPASTYSYANTSQTPTADQSRSTATRAPTAYTYTAPRPYRASSPYLTQQQQKSKADTASSGLRRPSNSSSTSVQTSPRDQYQQSSRPANTGQPRAPSMTPSSIQQQASSHHARQSAPADPPAPITVDPSHVYDPWPEQQRKIKQLEEKRRVEAAVRAEREEKERKAEEEKNRIEDERERAQEVSMEAEKERNRQRHLEVNRILEETSRRQRAQENILARVAARRDNPPSRPSVSNEPPAQPSQPAGGPVANGSDQLEIEMLAMFQKMREYNAKNPTLLARLWEQERQSHIAEAQSPTPAAAALPARPTPSTTPVISTAPSTMSRGPRGHADPASTTNTAFSSTSAISSKPGPKPPAAQAGPASAIWPPGKKVHLAEAAAKWLNAKPENAHKHISAERIVELLNKNPSYLTLCETLEHIGLAVDRAAFARALLSSVPDINKTGVSQQNSVNQPIVMAQLANPAGISGGTLEASTPATKPPKKKGPNAGKYPGQRGRPRKDGAGFQRTGTGTPQPQTGVSPSDQRNTVDLTVPKPSIARPSSLAQMYQDATRDEGEQSTVAYQSDFSYIPPPDDGVDYSMPDAMPTTQAQQAPQLARASLASQPVRDYQSPYFGAGTAQTSTRPNNQSTEPLPPRKPPASKEEAARKRTFADLVDLTAEQDSDEDMTPAAKSANTQQYPVSGVHVSDQQWGQNHFQQYAYDGTRQNDFTVNHPSVPPGGAPASHVSQPVSVPTTNVANELKNKILVQAIQREKVARKSKYDPRTICRDVLLATGRHPEMHGLNQHLFDMQELLKKHSANAELYKFDLATIRWDLIDPGEPIAEVADQEDADADADDEGEGTQDNAVSAVYEPTFQVAKNGQLLKPFGKKRRIGRPPKSNWKPADLSASGGETSAGATPNTSTSKHVHAPLDASSTPKLDPERKDLSMTPGSGAIGYAAFNATNVTYDENGKPIKKKGRPVGWRKDVHSKAALAARTGETPPVAMKSAPARRQGQTPPNYDQVPRRRGRPSMKNAHINANRDPEPTFNVYICEWQDCNAELHNIDTLRKHLIKIHGKKSSEGNYYQCLWRDCHQPATADLDLEQNAFSFETMGPWMEHVESQHIMPVAQTLGDGPRAGLSGCSAPPTWFRLR